MDNTQYKTTGLIFSKDRPMQLQAVIDSLRLHLCDASLLCLAVLFKASSTRYRMQYQTLQARNPDIAFIEETDFRNQVLSLVRSSPHILFLVDDSLFVGGFSLSSCIDALNAHPDALGFSLRLGTNITYSYMKNQPIVLRDYSFIGNDMIRFDWTRQTGDFGYPFDLSSSLYRGEQILPLLERLSWTNPNHLEGNVAANHIVFRTNPYLISFTQSVTLCVPINLVQTVCSNRSGKNTEYSIESLADRFDEGLSIDVSRFNGVVPSACHQELPLSFQPIRPAVSVPSGDGISHSTPLVSVEMVTYNAERFIARAIHSVLKQTFRDFELVIVDDGSTDSTPQVVAGFTDPRIRYIRRPHGNAALARNCAVSESRGRYILIVDSDDSIGPDYLRTMVDDADAHPRVDYIYPMRLTLVDEQAKPVGVHWDYPAFDASGDILLHLFRLGRLPIPNPGSLIRREVFVRGGGYENLDTVEDYVFLCRNVLDIRFKRCSRTADYFYRRSDSGLSRRFEIRNQITARVLDEMAQRYLPEVLCPEIMSISDPSIKQLRFDEIVMMTFYRLAQLHLGRGDTFFRQKGDQWLSRLADLARRIDPSCPWLMSGWAKRSAMIHCGLECLRNGQFADVLVYLDQALAIDTRTPNLQYARAVAFLAIGRNDQAVSACKSECQLGPHPEAEHFLRQLGVSFESLNEHHSFQPSNVSETAIPVLTT